MTSDNPASRERSVVVRPRAARPYAYIHRVYGFDFRPGQGVRLENTDRCGTVVRMKPSAEHYVQVRFGDAKHASPCHPSSLILLAAERTLRHLGYTYTEGAEYWRPSLGKRPDFALSPVKGVVMISYSSFDDVDRHLRGCLPSGTPPSYTKIVRAWVKTPGRQKVFAAELIMFDGQPGRVEVFKAGEALGVPIWGHRWLSLPGGSISFEDGRWIRIDPETLEPFATPPARVNPVERTAEHDGHQV